MAYDGLQLCSVAVVAGPAHNFAQERTGIRVGLHGAFKVARIVQGDSCVGPLQSGFQHGLRRDGSIARSQPGASRRWRASLGSWGGQGQGLAGRRRRRGFSLGGLLLHSRLLGGCQAGDLGEDVALGTQIEVRKDGRL